MPRPPLDVGTYGKIRFYETATGWRAMTKYRDYDGVTRPVERSGRTQSLAEKKLKKELRDRLTPAQHAGLSPDSKFREAAELWIKEFEEAVEEGVRSPTSLDTYRGRLNTYVLPALGELRLREITVFRIDQTCQSVRKNKSVDSARTVRNIISGICGLAVRYKAMQRNPVRDMGQLEGRRKASRALESDEMRDLLTKLDESESAIKYDLPDLVRWYAGTGFRTGEALAVHWHHLDLEAGTVDWAGNLIRATGRGQMINDGKTEVSGRAVALPTWLVAMLRERRARLAERFGIEPDEISGPLFPNSKGGHRDKHNTLARWRDFRSDAGYPWVTFRTFRRSVATVLDEAGLTAREVADQLGHSKVSTTQDVYMGRRVKSRKAADALSRVEWFGE
ncbi:Site-specific recombinase XerD [Saccharopolyspora shandongensis]|uniref:Site-specific recombinase XerD n=1 Tax=Saccharopolyspora shandongensis TaxID=418495 RepID=A0A1H3M4F2_9PSEU|nr:Site-specific recombinase XerD [Saccharopolyspora shandongensis]